MTADELRSKWTLAFPQERDAMVAEVMGLKPRQLTEERDGFMVFLADRSTAEPGDYVLDEEHSSPHRVHAYSTSWAVAGLLLDDLLTLLRRNGNMEAVVRLQAVVEEGMRWEVKWTPGPPEWMQRVSAATAPEAIALAYCLAKLETTP